ncbi:type I DNA topoisomerase [Candidatus Peregrinibacteria bacterium]|nr:type I DNA topoisomerase [Candidatus Peregrinibacteria bacterium]
MGKNLVIVESPAKAKTISKFLSKDFQVEASIGHIRDLPSNAQEVPEKHKGEKWARLGVDVDHDFKPLYIIPDTKKKQVSKLKDAIKKADVLYLATDEDREGESISWHLLEILKPKVPVKRLVFHEITKEAIQGALKNPRTVDMNLVHAQETRRILDRLYGYEVSPVLWKKIAPRLSAGRVQSVAIRLVVEREKMRQKFKPSSYFDLTAEFLSERKDKFSAELKEIFGKKLVHGKDFDPETGKLKGTGKIHLNEKEANDLKEAILKNDFQIGSIEQKPFTRNPEAPFTTSTLQQEAARKLRYSAKKTMQVAQKLYENGYITYMRTDSTTLAESAVKEARSLATKLYGAEYIAEKPRQFASKIKNAQEAHEAIRPSGSTFALPETLAKSGKLTDEEAALYELIWKRTIASQMKEAKMMSTIVEVTDEKHVFVASGKQIIFAGFLKAYVQGSDDPEE